MIEHQGIVLNPGAFSGCLQVMRHWESLPQGRPQEPDSPEGRIKEYAKSLENTVLELNRLALEARSEDGREILEAQVMMLEDTDFQDSIRNRILLDNQSVFQAVLESSEEYAALFLSMDDPVFKSKAQDIRDVSSRLLQQWQKHLTGKASTTSDRPAPVQGSVLFFERLLPSRFAEVENAQPAGILVREGSVRSHLAILCAEAGIPLVCCPEIEWNDEWNGLTICVSDDGRIVLDPDAEQLRRFCEAARSDFQRTSHNVEEVTLPEKIRYQGEDIQLLLNIDGGYFSQHPEAVFDGDGIGLLRSEFSYIGRETPPTEEELFQEYRNAVLAMKGRRCVIRTLDLGSDKQAACLPRDEEPNPALGIRGIRYSLLHPELFRTQLRAIYRASAYGPLAMMFPMVSSMEEIRQAKQSAAAVREELSRQGIAFGEIETGIMIETPAAALLCEDWAGETDFFCVGSNDLTQYTLAADRENAVLGRSLNEFHPAVALLLRRIAETARKHHIELCLCGELARMPEATATLLEWGYRSFSVSAVYLSSLRQRLKQIQES